MTNPNWNRQVKIGHGRGDTGAHHRAVEAARQLPATGRWPNHLNTLIVIIHRHLPRPVTAHAFRQRGQFAHFGHVTHPIPTQFLKGVRADKNQLVIIERADDLLDPATDNAGRIGFQEAKIETQVGVGDRLAFPIVQMPMDISQKLP